jgi:CRP-like cAMP-binding protein
MIACGRVTSRPGERLRREARLGEYLADQARARLPPGAAADDDALGQQSAHQRLAMFLLDFMRNPDFFDETHARLTVSVNRFDLADYLGTTRESAARAFNRLELEGLVKRINSHTIEILSLKGLQQLQHGRPRRTADRD